LVIAAQQPALLKLGANGLIDLAARGIVGGNNQRSRGRFGIASSNFPNAFLLVGKFANAALLLEESKARLGVSLCELLDRLP